MEKNYTKEFIRGSIKELLKARGLRSISFANYDRWANKKNTQEVHTVNYDIEKGYIRFYRYKENSHKRGDMMHDVTLETYEKTYKRAKDILKHEKEIPYKVKRNILVGLYR